MWSRIYIPLNYGINEKGDAHWNITTKSVYTQYRYVYPSHDDNEILVQQWPYLQKKMSEER